MNFLYRYSVRDGWYLDLETDDDVAADNWVERLRSNGNGAVRVRVADRNAPPVVVSAFSGRAS